MDPINKQNYSFIIKNNLNIHFKYICKKRNIYNIIFNDPDLSFNLSLSAKLNYGR